MDAERQTGTNTVTDPKEEIKRKTLQITGICTRVQYKQFTINAGLKHITSISNEIDMHVDNITEAHNTDKTNLQAKNRELAKSIHNLRKQLKDIQHQLNTTQQQLLTTQEQLEAANADLDKCSPKCLTENPKIFCFKVTRLLRYGLA